MTSILPTNDIYKAENEDYKQKYLQLMKQYELESEKNILVDTVTEIYTPSVFTEKPVVDVSQQTQKTVTYLSWSYEDDNGSWDSVSQTWSDIVTAKFDSNNREMQNFTVKVGEFQYDITIENANGHQINKSTKKRE